MPWMRPRTPCKGASARKRPLRTRRGPISERKRLLRKSLLHDDVHQSAGNDDGLDHVLPFGLVGNSCKRRLADRVLFGRSLHDDTGANLAIYLDRRKSSGHEVQ